MSYSITIIGTGIMASGIAIGFVQKGCKVRILGRSLDSANHCRSRVNSVVQTGLPIIVDTINQLNDWTSTDWIIETVTEDLSIKKDIFTWLDQKVPGHIPIGSNSSGFSISKISQGLSTSYRMMNAHYFMPAEIVPLVEIVIGQDTSIEIAKKVCEMYINLGRKPILVKKDIPGFLANRIQHALMREALSLLDSGVASMQDIDDAVRYSFGFRYAAIGPLMQKEISGWDTTSRAADEIYPSLSNINETPALIKNMLHRGDVGIKSGKGLLDWDEQSAETIKQEYQRRLAEALKILIK